MKKLFKSKTFVGALLSIALCVSLITGATFAIFTSEANVNIAVTSGTVKVTAEVTGLTLYSPTTLNADGSVANKENAATENAFKNGGTAAMNGGKLQINGITPGDKATVELTITNEGNVSTLYRYGYTLLSSDDEAYDGDALVLFEGLNFVFDEMNAKTVTDTETSVIVAYKTAYAELPESKTVTAVVELPGTAGNKYQDLSLTIAFVVEAVQANIDTTNNVEELTSVTFAGENLNDKLGEDGATVAITEKSTIDSTTKIGNGVTITGLGKDKSVLNIEKGKITAENVTIKDVTIKGKAPAGNDGALQVTGKNTTIDNVNFEGQGFNGDTKAISYSGEGFVIKNSKISGAFRGIIFWDNIGGDNLIENCVIDNVIYTFNLNAATVKPGTTITIRNSTLNGWTSYSGCMSRVTFLDCNLGLSYGYAYLVAYADSEFTNCTFNDGYQVAIGKNTTGKTLTFTNCKLADGTLITAENFATVLGDVDNDMKNNTVIVNGVTVSWN